MVRPKSHQPLDEAGTRLRQALKAGERLGAIHELLRRGRLRRPHIRGLREWWRHDRGIGIGGHGCVGGHRRLRGSFRRHALAFGLLLVLVGEHRLQGERRARHARPLQQCDTWLRQFGFEEAARIGSRRREIAVAPRTNAEPVECDEPRLEVRHRHVSFHHIRGARIQAYRFWLGDEQNKENRLGVMTVSCSSVNPSGTTHPRADYFFPMGSLVS